MKRVVRTLAVVVTAAILIGAAAAEAASGWMHFVGSMTISPGVGTPVLVPDRHGTWTLSNAGALPHMGVGATSEGDAGPATIDLAGTFEGNCAVSRAYGEAGVMNIGGTKRVYVSNFVWIQSTSSLIVGQGSTSRWSGGPTTGFVEITMTVLAPVPGIIGAGSCAAGTATQFTVIGDAVFTY